MNTHNTPMYCHSCENLGRDHGKVELCNHHHQPAYQIVTHCIDVGGKKERPGAAALMEKRKPS